MKQKGVSRKEESVSRKETSKRLASSPWTKTHSPFWMIDTPFSPESENDTCVADYSQPLRSEAAHACLTQSVFKVVLQKLIPTQIRRLVLYISDSKG